MLDVAYLARERALAMAQTDAARGLIAVGEVIPRACQYEAYLTGHPVAVAALPEPRGSDAA